MCFLTKRVTTRDFSTCKTTCKPYIKCPLSYNLTQTLTNTFNPNDNANDNSAQIVALATSSCTKDFIEIESSAEICYSPITYTRYCGFTLSTALGANTEEAARSGSDNTICGESTSLLVQIQVAFCKFFLIGMLLNKTCY